MGHGLKRSSAGVILGLVLCLAGSEVVLAGRWRLVRRQDFEAKYTGIDFVNARLGWVTAQWPEGGGFVLHTSDGGESWDVQLRWDRPHYFGGLDFVDSLHGWVAADSGVILRTRDGGQTWEELRGLVGQDFWLYDLCFVDTLRGWATSNTLHTIHMTLDGGLTWTDIHISGRFGAISFVDSMTGWVFGRNIVHTTDGGMHWEIQRRWPGNIGLGCFLNRSFGWTFARGLIGDSLYITHDGGNHWECVWADEDTVPGNFEPVDCAFIDSLRAWMVGYESCGVSLPAILRTTDGGRSWRPEDFEWGRTLREGGMMLHIFALDTINAWATGLEGLGGYGVILKYDTTGASGVNGPVQQQELHSTQPLSLTVYPVPSRGLTSIRLTLPRRMTVHLSVFDVCGRELRHLHTAGPIGPGVREFQWDGTDETGRMVPNGTYLVVVSGGGWTASRKAVVLR